MKIWVFQHKHFKFQMIWTRIGPAIWLRSETEFFETLCTSQMILNFRQRPVYQILKYLFLDFIHFKN